MPLASSDEKAVVLFSGCTCGRFLRPQRAGEGQSRVVFLAADMIPHSPPVLWLAYNLHISQSNGVVTSYGAHPTFN
jgi:hypothetical protein